MNDRLAIWTIYERPADYPEGYVLREWLIGPGGAQRAGVAFVGPLEAMRDLMEENGLTCLPRSPEDEPQIVESWI